jgi:hypothetical protein
MDLAKKSPRAAWPVALALLSLSLPAAAQDEGWDWMVEPYAWAASIGTDMRTVEPPTEAGNDTSFSDIVKKLDGVFMGRIEGRNDDFGVFADFIYLGLAQDKQKRFLSTDTDLDARLLDAAFSLRFGGQREAGLDVFAGVRYIDVDLTTRFVPDNAAFEPRTLDLGKSYLDLLLGGRYAWRLSDRWGLALRADGSLGQTKGTWSSSLMASYRTRRGDWLFGYRYLDGEFGNSNLDVGLNLSGPLLGYGFRF